MGDCDFIGLHGQLRGGPVLHERRTGSAVGFVGREAWNYGRTHVLHRDGQEYERTGHQGRQSRYRKCLVPLPSGCLQVVDLNLSLSSSVLFFFGCMHVYVIVV